MQTPNELPNEIGLVFLAMADRIDASREKLDDAAFQPLAWPDVPPCVKSN